MKLQHEREGEDLFYYLPWLVGRLEVTVKVKVCEDKTLPLRTHGEVHGVTYKRRTTTYTHPWHGPPHPIVYESRETLPVNVLSREAVREIEATVLEAWSLDRDGGPR